MVDKKFNNILCGYDEITVRYDTDTAAIWCYLNLKEHPCYTPGSLQEMHNLQLSIIEYFKSHHMNPKIPIRYLILASQTDGVFNYGGDLELFSKFVMNKDRRALGNYAQKCIDVIHLQSKNLNLPITTIALVEGTALGGGFEAALSCDIIIAQKDTKFGLPEIRYNLFPGMGAYSLLARKIGIQKTEEILTSGKIYTAQELHTLGVVTILAEPHEAQKTLDDFIHKESRLFNGMQAIRSSKNIYNNIDYLELLDISKVWVETALKLQPKDLKLMKQLVKVQTLKNIKKRVRTKQDRRISKQISGFPFTDYSNNIILNDRRVTADRRA
jgi:DSF synthase